MKKEDNIPEPKLKKRHWLLYTGIIVVILLIIFGTNLYLWVKLLIGNDIIINVNVDPKNIYLGNNEEQVVNVKTSIIANPFCDASCNYEFSDISNNISIEKQDANIETLNSLEKEYTLIAPAKGTGQVLYRLDVQCKGIKKLLCQTSGELNKKTVLVTLDYDLNNQELEEKNKFKENYLNLNKNINEKIYFLEQVKIDLNRVFLDTKNIDNVINLLEEFSKSNNNTIVYWDNQDYAMANYMLNDNLKDYASIESEFNSTNRTITSEINKNNQLSFSFENVLTNISHITTIPLNETDLLNAEEIIGSSNEIIDILNNNSINSQEVKILQLQNEVNIFLNTDKTYPLGQKVSTTLKVFNPFYINYTYPSYNETLILKEPSSQCCFFNNCNSCCDQLCYNDNNKYPILFLHGHSFSVDISPEYNLNIFEELQRAIEQDNYINAGSLILGNSDTDGVLGRAYSPVSLKASYYFDIIQEEGKTNTLYTKQDNIDTYAIRLKDIIEETKLTTNRDKVILVTHSMGGLVARRYLQIFGSNSVYEVILIAAPNHGISKEVHDQCLIFGNHKECEDMYEQSLLINKLNTQTSVGETKVYNIIGLGCSTYGEDGDGIVTKSSAYLSFANNYYLNGTCPGTFDYFHNSIINPAKTPEIKELVLKILNEN